MKTRALALTAVMVLVLGGVAGCGGTKKPDKPVPERLATAQKYLNDTDGVKIGLSTPALPQGVQGVLKADGIGTKQPAFKGARGIPRPSAWRRPRTRRARPS